MPGFVSSFVYHMCYALASCTALVAELVGISLQFNPSLKVERSFSNMFAVEDAAVVDAIFPAVSSLCVFVVGYTLALIPGRRTAKNGLVPTARVLMRMRTIPGESGYISKLSVNLSRYPLSLGESSRVLSSPLYWSKACGYASVQ